MITMRILYFSENYSIHDHRFLVKMVESGHEIFFMRLDNNDHHLEARNIPAGVKIVTGLNEQSKSENPEKLRSLVPSFKESINAISPDIVHAGHIQSCGYLTALIDFHPFILMSWGSDILVDADKNELLRGITRFTLKRSDRILCDCNAVREKIHQMVEYNDEKIIQFPWGVNLQLFKPGPDFLDLKSKYGWADCYVILSSRMWEPIYGIKTVLHSFYIAYSKNPRLRLILLGDGSLSADIKNFIHKYNLEKIIMLPGIIDNDLLPDFYRSVDLYLSCSFSDGSSVSLLEALASGLPVVVTDFPSNREWIVNEKNGFLSPADDKWYFAEAINRISTKNKSELKIISKNNREVAEKRANWNKNILKLFDTYGSFEKMKT